MFEKKNGKRFLASVMALVMLLSLAPVGALAADDEPLTTEECSGVAQQAVVDTKDTNENTPTEPAKDSDSAEATKPEGGSDLDEIFSADADTSNDIVEQNFSLNKAPKKQSILVNAKFFINLGSKDDSNREGIGEFTGDITINNALNYTLFKEKQSRDMTSNNGYIFERNGVKTVTGCEGNNLLRAEPRDDQINSALSAKQRTDLSVGGEGNRYVVWYHVSDCGGIYHVDGYIANRPITITYDPNGGVFSSEVDTDPFGKHTINDCKSGDTYEIIDAIPTRDGYEFAGWKLGDEDKIYQSTDSIVPTGDVTLVAQWEEIYTVTFNAGDNGTLTGNLTQTGVSGTTLTEPIKTANTGYEFVGWVKGSDTTTMVRIPATITENATYTATWEEEQTTEPENPTSEINAKYFVLMPNMTAPANGSSQGVGNYFPNDRDCGGVEGKTASTGYPGKIKSILLSDHKGAKTQQGYANTKNGIGEEYLVLPENMGYFSKKNYANGEYTGYNKENFPNVLKNLVGENQKFDMKNYQIVWYVVKKENNGYHVDGYVKGVPIQLNYYDGFNEQKIFDTENLQSGNPVTIKSLPDSVTHEGWTFVGWFTKDGKKYEVGSSHTLIDSLNLYARWEKSYEVVTHFMDADGNPTASRTNSGLNGVHGTPLKDMVLSLDKVERNDISGNYVYVPSETSYSVDEVDKGKVGDATYTEANTVIHQYYYLDETGKIGKDEENKPTDESDKIPDAWQYKVTFQVENGSWDNKTNEAIVKYVTKKDAAGKDSATGTATLADVPAVGNEPNSGYRASGSWDEPPSVGLEIKKDTVFTYTYSRRSSSGGSSRPSTPPTVDIPDDVPTGLNGKDHYAYIIGYGNNDVRPQNNITRAEVATIFFRLLTDETREANMTKSNGYNDVKDGDWFCCAVSTLSKMGIIKGYEDGSFKPNDPISRAEFAAIAARFDPDGDKTPATFADVTSHWAKDEISIAANHGWIKGYEDGSFKPDQKITRAETMTLVNRVLNRLPETKDDLHKDMKTWVDNMDETAWYYLAVQEATNSHYFKNKTGTKFEQWTDLRDTRDWSELEK